VTAYVVLVALVFDGLPSICYGQTPLTRFLWICSTVHAIQQILVYFKSSYFTFYAKLWHILSEHYVVLCCSVSYK